MLSRSFKFYICLCTHSTSVKLLYSKCKTGHGFQLCMFVPPKPCIPVNCVEQTKVQHTLKQHIQSKEKPIEAIHSLNRDNNITIVNLHIQLFISWHQNTW